jgi:hypothetical protein
VRVELCAGQILIIHPGATYCEVSHGLNVVERVYHATFDWPAWGQRAQDRARRLGRPTGVPCDLLLARAAARAVQDVGEFEHEKAAANRDPGTLMPADPRHPLHMKVYDVPPLTGCTATDQARKPRLLMVPRGAAWSVARFFVLMMRRLREARGALKQHGARQRIVPREQPLPPCTRCGAACFGVAAVAEEGAAGSSSGGGGGDGGGGQWWCSRCIIANSDSLDSSWDAVVSEEMPELEAHEQKLDVPSILWVADPDDEEEGGAVGGDEDEDESEGGEEAAPAKQGDGGEDEVVAEPALAVHSKYLGYHTAFGPGMPSSSPRPGDVPGAWGELLLLPLASQDDVAIAAAAPALVWRIMAWDE